MNEFVLNLIILFHYIFIIFVVITPFVGNNILLLSHVIIIPFIILHWILNDNTCSLTILERFIRYKLYNQMPSDSDCITFNLIAPIYDFKKNNEGATNLIYLITISLWLIALFRLITKYNSENYSSLKEFMID
jgi:hypothetical protein